MGRAKLKQATVEAVEAPRCANCAADLVGPYCHACGQKAHLHHKLSHLMEEFVEGIAHFDGRLWRTLPILAFNPGRLSREWRDGKRMTYVAPLHVFLFAVFLMFMIPNVTGQHLINFDAKDRAPGQQGLAVQVDPEDGAWAERFRSTLEEKSGKSEYYGYKIETLAYKLSFMVVPISMGILWLLTLWPRRGFTLYDHAVVSLYGVGFLALAVSLVMMAPGWVGAALGAVLLIGAPVHAVWHLKGAYGMSWPGAVVRGVLLGALSAAGFMAFVVGVVFLGLAG